MNLHRRGLVWLALSPLLMAPAQASGPEVPGSLWRSLGPVESGWSAERLRAADVIARQLGSGAVLVVHKGVQVHAFGDPARPMPLYSVRKSLLSVLFGIAQARGQVDLQATLAQLGIDDHQPLSAQEKTATVQQLLQARSGVYHHAAYEAAADAALRPERGSHAPGSYWYYNNWDFNVLGTIFGQLAGVDLFTALQRDLAQPLQFEDFQQAEHTRWQLERVSRYPAYPIELSARDLARVGLLMARGGRWGERQLLPQEWVAESTRPYSIETPGWQGYGYMWWVPQRAWPFWTRQPGDLFMASGSHGQVMLVDRARDLVIVHRVDGNRFFHARLNPGRLTPLLEQLFAAMPP